MEGDEGNEERRNNGREGRFPCIGLINIQLDANFDGLAHTKSFDGRPPLNTDRLSIVFMSAHDSSLELRARPCEEEVRVVYVITNGLRYERSSTWKCKVGEVHV